MKKKNDSRLNNPRQSSNKQGANVTVASRPFAVFDIDGTLIRWQLYHAVVDRLAKNGLLGHDAHEKIKSARMVWKRRIHENAFDDYQNLLVDVYEKSINNIPVDEFIKFVDEIAEEYKEQVYTYTRDLLRDLKKKNYFLIAISGSHKELISHIAKLYKFDEWVGSEYKHTGGKFTGERFLASNHKQNILQEITDKYRLNTQKSYGVGDSRSDIPILEKVKHPIAFNPDKELYAHALSKKWKIVIERKNVIYQLNYDDGKYKLDLAK